jgi:hypothetical protein
MNPFANKKLAVGKDLFHQHLFQQGFQYLLETLLLKIEKIILFFKDSV